MAKIKTLRFLALGSFQNLETYALLIALHTRSSNSYRDPGGREQTGGINKRSINSADETIDSKVDIAARSISQQLTSDLSAKVGRRPQNINTRTTGLCTCERETVRHRSASLSRYGGCPGTLGLTLLYGELNEYSCSRQAAR
jgi:hypothetical protein